MNYHTTTRPVFDDAGNQVGFEQINVPFTSEEELEWQKNEDAHLAAALPNARSALLLQIDNDTDALIKAVVGERAGEYERAERESIAYRDSGYAGAVPGSVEAWATAKNRTSTQATDDIIATATNWRAAQSAIRANRLLNKERARSASIDELDAIKSDWASFLAVITLGIVQ